MNIRTDLAVEVVKETGKTIEGTEAYCEMENDIKTERIKILTAEASEKTGKPVGSYVTLTVRDLSENDREEYENISLKLADELKSILNVSKKAPVMVVGLGNEDITADSVGPKCVKKVLVTRHIKEMMPEEIDESVRSVSAIAPSVMGMTGIETENIVKGVAEKVKPEAIIVVDALASRSMSRLGKTIQIADSGINPGSGVGNNRKELSKNTLGIPVVAIGVPMVTDARTVVFDCMQIAKEHDREEMMRVYEASSPEDEMMIVTPKDADSLSTRCAGIIANGINLALQSALGKNDIDRYTFV